MDEPDSGTSGDTPDGRDYPPDVHFLETGGREFILVGTAHVSRESAELVREVIDKERPACVCIELDAQRFEALSKRKRFQDLDLKQVIRQRQLAPLIANLVLAAYQKKLGGALGVMPGSELLEAAAAARDHEIPVALCDRDVRITLRRAWASMSLWNKAKLLAALIAGAIDRPELDEEELRRIRDQDVLSELMRELGEELPGIKTTLIDERDAYLSHRIREAEGERVVAVVGAGHVEGIRRALLEAREVDVEEISRIPPVGRLFKAVGWGVPALILGALAWIAIDQGARVAGENLLYWIVANGVPTTLGALCALAHPAVVVSAFAVAPVTSLIPVIGAGYVLAFLQAWWRPPVVREFESLGEDVGELRQWWRSKLLRILLVFLLTTLGSFVGTWVGGVEIVSSLFGP